jgi:hypothetical protein
MTISEHARRPAAVHRVLQRIRIRLFALAAQFLLAVKAITARNLKTGDDSLALFELFDVRADGVDHTAELVAEDIAFLQLDYGTVQEM